jgi:hypothetical protein
MYRKRKDRELSTDGEKSSLSLMERPGSGGGVRSWKKMARGDVNVTTLQGNKDARKE